MAENGISDEFVKRHYAGLHVLLQRQIKDEAVAADMLNEAVVVALSHMRIGRVTEPDRLPGYVYRVAMNLYRNYRRGFDNRTDLRVDVELIEQLPADSGTPGSSVDEHLLTQLRKLIGELPTLRDRQIVTRFYLNEEAKADICKALNLSALHFDKVIFRARQRMRALLEARGFDKKDLLSVLIFCCAIGYGS